jgi:hypothetical protein
VLLAILEQGCEECEEWVVCEECDSNQNNKIRQRQKPGEESPGFLVKKNALKFRLQCNKVIKRRVLCSDSSYEANSQRNTT